MLTINNTLDGYLKDVEIFGNTIQDADNLADIRSVGDTVEGQELYEIPVLSRGKNLFDGQLQQGAYSTGDGSLGNSDTLICSKNMIFVQPNRTYILSNSSNYNFAIRYYDYNKKYVSGISSTSNNTKFIVPSGIYYMHIILVGLDITTQVQIEEGTVATEYEPYQEDKLTILSPVQLEKVGDVCDRIIEKDGVWGVEKNVVTKVLNGNEGTWYITNNGEYLKFGNYGVCTDAYFTAHSGKPVISDKFITGVNSSGETTQEQVMYYCHGDLRAELRVSILASKVGSTGFEGWLKDNNVTIKYRLAQPQFIPLPHDQQIKLRTFANKTNISFGCEIEGTIKAQVPKSLGATVNTHTEQISNLNKELDRVKKLEESTVSTVETESDFTTVEATSNGYFEDVKLEGKTLVNLAKTPKITYTITNTDVAYVGKAGTHLAYPIDKDKEYTFIVNIIKCPSDRLVQANTYGAYANFAFPGKTLGSGIGTYIFKQKAIPSHNLTSESIWLTLGCDKGSSGEFEASVVILEGDHTQNPPNGYIEGLKSVGQSATTSEDGADEIVVSSVKGDGNLIPTFDGFIVENNFNNSVVITDTKIEGIPSVGGFKVIKPTYLNEGSYTCSTDGHTGINVRVRILNTDRSIKIANVVNQSFTIDKSGLYIVSIENNGNTETSFSIEGLYIYKYGKQKPDLYSYQSDKKRLLYYNNETQAWEKPILRQWDSIEKHTNGKYYYHQRSGEVVLNGSEDYTQLAINDNTIACKTSCISTDMKVGTILSSKIVCDKLQVVGQSDITNNFVEGISAFEVVILSIAKSKLSTQDVAGFKQWLQTNNVTVVYQLAQEKVYECTNIDLITYANETNYVVESGAIAPKSILKVHNNISNVVKILQEKVSILESNVKASQEVQDMMILETDMRMLDIELALMEFMPMKLNLGGSDMLRSATYFNFLKNHIVNETYEKEYLENVMNKYLATGRINQDEYDELYKMLYPPVYDIELPIEP